MKTGRATIIAFCLLMVFLANGSLGQENLKIEQTIFVKKEAGALKQLVSIVAPQPLPLKVIVQARTEKKQLEEFLQFSAPPTEIRFLVPACDKGKCPVELKVFYENKILLGQGQLDLKPVRPWKIYLAPFTHIDIGFTQSQPKVLIQNLENLKTELALIEQTRDYPERSRFRMFVEAGWAVDEFLNSEEITAEEKEKLKKAIREKNIELGGFYISHQNKFMPDEALFASLNPALRITDALEVPLQTACIHDVFDFSAVVKPLSAAGVKYLLVGPNDTRYMVPPLFYLTPPGGTEKVLVWHSANLNGYGENFDLKMRLMPPIPEAAFSEMEMLIGRHLKSLENGFPNQIITEHFDFHGASWSYPYDAYLLPFYPAVGGDNQPQNIAPSEIARKWNEEWVWPQLLVSTPADFFEYVEKNFPAEIPTVRGEMSGFWGEQIFLSMMQVDPQKEIQQREFERKATEAGIALADKFLSGESVSDPTEGLWQGYKPLILDNDHNPMPVPFGGLNYSLQDMRDWKTTRAQWISQMEETGNFIFEKAVAGLEKTQESVAGNSETARAFREGNDFILENGFYRIEVDGKTGGIKSLYDKERKRELVKPGSPYLLNQYLQAVRGEAAGMRDYLKVKPGYRSVKISLSDSGPQKAALKIEGKLERRLNGAEALAKFAGNAFGIKLPASALETLVPVLFFQNKTSVRLTQKIILPAGEKRIEFVQHFSGNMPQWVEHIFAYPLNLPASTPIEYDAGYNLLSFTPGPPLGNGDIIPGAKITAPFPSINASLVPFEWMRGLPPDLTFRNYLMLRGEDFAIAFSSAESGAVIPGPLAKDPEQGPFGGEFYHLGLGWTLWGKIGLGADLEKDVVINSALTSFPAKSDAEAKSKAIQFAWNYLGKRFSDHIKINPSTVLLVNAWPENDSLVMRLWESSGQKTDMTVELETGKKLQAVYRARSDGKPLSSLGFQGNRVPLEINAGEILTLRLEFE